MKRTTTIITLFVLILFASNMRGQTNVTFLNTGKMYVAPGAVAGRVSLYVPDAMRQLTISGSTVEVVQNGITELGGNFYQDALNNVFPIDASTKTTSTGKFRFVKDHPGVNRMITTQSKNITIFDRGSYYIAFPNIEIGTNDSIEIPSKMGIDASSLHRVNAKTGKMILRSQVSGINAFDASLRITQTGTSSALVDLGSVVVERDMTTYRPSNGSTQLFGFATPFKTTQISGYFAGNWLRRPLGNGTYGHTTYIYGDKDASPADGVIDEDQYVYLAAEKLVPAQAYFVKPRPKDYSYTQLKSTSGLWYTGEANPNLYDKGKFNFNGKVYTVNAYSEQLFADDVLYSNSINNSNLPSTVNWVIGNSYTCPISTALLADKLRNSNLVFAPYIYVYPSGSATYQVLNISGDEGVINPYVIDEIPAMSVFMVRVSKGSSQIGNISIGKDLLRHATVSHNNPLKVRGAVQSASTVTNQVTFKVSPVDNENIYDVTAIGLRADALSGSDKYDMAKAYVSDDNIFQLYTLSSTGVKLSANGLPLTADSIVMAFNPSKYGGNFVLTTKYTETLTTPGVWLYDKKNQQVTNLKTNSYSFTSQATDQPERFLILFSAQLSTEITNPIDKLTLFYHDKKVHVKNLNSDDLGSRLVMYDVQGKQLHAGIVNNYPEMTIDLNNVSPGVYILQLKGKRASIARFVIN